MKIIYLHFFLFCLCLVASGCGDSKEDFEQISNPQNSSGALQRESGFVLGIESAELDVTSDTATLRLKASDLTIRSTTQAGGPEFSLDQFLQHVSPSSSAPFPMSLSFRGDVEARKDVSLSLTNVEGDSSGTVTFSGRVDGISQDLEPVLNRIINDVQVLVLSSSQKIGYVYFVVQNSRYVSDGPREVRVRSLADTTYFDQTFYPTQETNGSWQVSVPYSKHHPNNFAVDFSRDGFETSTILGRLSAPKSSRPTPEVFIACYKLQSTSSGLKPASYTLKLKNDNLFKTDATDKIVQISGDDYYYETATGDGGEAKFESIVPGVTLTVTPYLDSSTPASSFTISLQSDKKRKDVVILKR